MPQALVARRPIDRIVRCALRGVKERPRGKGQRRPVLSHRGWRALELGGASLRSPEPACPGESQSLPRRKPEPAPAKARACPGESRGRRMLCPRLAVPRPGASEPRGGRQRAHAPRGRLHCAGCATGGCWCQAPLTWTLPRRERVISVAVLVVCAGPRGHHAYAVVGDGANDGGTCPPRGVWRR
jgi:hypothetical protein